MTVRYLHSLLSLSGIQVSRTYTVALGMAVGALVGVPACSAQAPGPQHAPKAQFSSEQEAGTPAKDEANHQSIKVHGHWKIEVKNRDGSVAQIREFENSLQTTGANVLSLLLGGKEAVGQSAIDLTTTGTSICGSTHCATVPNTGGGMQIALNNLGGFNCTPGMTTTVSSNSIIYAGQLTASRAGSITSVSTYAGYCDPSATTSTCASGGSATTPVLFTATTITSVPVNSGQIVQVSVTISFS